jgi:hypothetical protein
MRATKIRFSFLLLVDLCTCGTWQPLPLPKISVLVYLFQNSVIVLWAGAIALKGGWMGFLFWLITDIISDELCEKYLFLIKIIPSDVL